MNKRSNTELQKEENEPHNTTSKLRGLPKCRGYLWAIVGKKIELKKVKCHSCARFNRMH